MKIRTKQILAFCLALVLMVGVAACQEQEQEPAVPSYCEEEAMAQGVNDLRPMMYNPLYLENVDAAKTEKAFAAPITVEGDFEAVVTFRCQGVADAKPNVVVEFSTNGLKGVGYANSRAYTMKTNGESEVTNSPNVSSVKQNWLAEPHNLLTADKKSTSEKLLMDAQVTLTLRRVGSILSVSGKIVGQDDQATWTANVKEEALPSRLNLFVGGGWCTLSDYRILDMKGGTYFNESKSHNVLYHGLDEYIAQIQDVSASYDMPAGSDSNLLGVKNVHLVDFLTGEHSPNKTETRFQLCGTDVGVPIVMGDKIYYLFGDSFYNTFDLSEWINNCIAWSTDLDYTDGLTIEGMLCEDYMGSDRISVLFPGLRQDNVEFSRIPTGGIAIGNTLYASFMSVRHWGGADEWWCNYGGVAKSTDEGKTWQVLEQLQFPGEKFGLIFPVIDGEWVYVWGTPGGRKDAAYLMRVPLDQYENFDAYTYYTGLDEAGEPVFQGGDEGFANCVQLLEAPVGEISAMYSEYLGEWMVTYASGMNIVLRTAKNPWGPYSEPMTIASTEDFSYPTTYMRLYCPYMHPALTSEGGQKVAFMLSHWSPMYNVMIMEMELVKK